MKLNEMTATALRKIADELQGELPGEPGNPLDFNRDPFGIFCQYGAWCLSDPVHGALKHVMRSGELRAEIGKLAELCTQRNQNPTEWQVRMVPIMHIAMGDAGGKEARAADFAYGLAKTMANQDPVFAAVAIRKMLRLTDAQALYTKLAELSR
jgi:hypothetical protein